MTVDLGVRLLPTFNIKSYLMVLSLNKSIFNFRINKIFAQFDLLIGLALYA